MSASHNHNPHDHHDHRHPPHPQQPDEESDLGYYPVLEQAVRELLIEKGHITAAEVREMVESIDARAVSHGAAVVARAWTDPAFKQRLLANGTEAVKEFGIDFGPLDLVVVENKADLHNLIVCTLCSCYPRPLLGRPPDWYKSKEYRARVVFEPRTVLKEMGTEIPENIPIRVYDSTADLRYLVLPVRPAGTEGWTAAQLEKLVTRDSMVGVIPASSP